MPSIDPIATGNNIRVFAKQKGKTPKDIQTACGFTTTNAVYKWMQGICMPSIDNMVVIADLFGVKIDDIVSVRKI